MINLDRNIRTLPIHKIPDLLRQVGIPVPEAVASAEPADLGDAVCSAAAEILEACAERFNTLAPQFEDAASSIPSLASYDPFTLSPEQFTAIYTATELAATLRGIWKAYDRVALIRPRWTARYGNESTVCRLGHYDTYAQVYDAVHYVGALERRGTDVPDRYRHLAPFIGVVHAGGTLRLAHPAKAEQHLDDLSGRSARDERIRVFNAQLREAHEENDRRAGLVPAAEKDALLP